MFGMVLVDWVQCITRDLLSEWSKVLLALLCKLSYVLCVIWSCNYGVMRLACNRQWIRNGVEALYAIHKIAKTVVPRCDG